MDTQPVVFLVDDEIAILEALGRLLRMEGFTVRAWNSSLQFLKDHQPEIPGCLVVDVRMPDLDGLELQRALQKSGSERPIVFVTGQGDISMTVQAMKAGAVSFLPKPVKRVELVAAVREAIAKDEENRAARLERRDVEMRVEKLTPRELQVLKLVTRGLLNKQIAAELGAAEKTIKVHRARVMQKMQVRSAAALVGLLGADRLAGSRS
ncbi:MAG TPA: response regulator [Steroidobacteraceae bacterium]|jgi:FixJ family two-component response regulator